MFNSLHSSIFGLQSRAAFGLCSGRLMVSNDAQIVAEDESIKNDFVLRFSSKNKNKILLVSFQLSEDGRCPSQPKLFTRSKFFGFVLPRAYKHYIKHPPDTLNIVKSYAFAYETFSVFFLFFRHTEHTNVSLSRWALCANDAKQTELC